MVFFSKEKHFVFPMDPYDNLLLERLMRVGLWDILG